MLLFSLNGFAGQRHYHYYSTYNRVHRRHPTRDKILHVAVPAAIGAGIGGIAAGGGGAGIGALVGGGAGGLFYLFRHHR
jgi:hypothetical protein